MRDVLSLLMFGIGAVFFAVFFAVLKPDTAVPVAVPHTPASWNLALRSFPPHATLTR
jgi:hypothetical protein